MRRADALFCAVNRWALIALLAVMAVLVVANVIARYVFSYSFPWVEEATRYMMIWSCFLGAGPALRVGGHIAVESLPQALPPRAAAVLRALLALLMAASLLVLAKLGADYVDFAWEQESAVLGWSLGKVYLAIPVGAVLTLAHLLLVAPSWVRSGAWEKVEGFDPQAL